MIITIKTAKNPVKPATSIDHCHMALSGASATRRSINVDQIRRTCDKVASATTAKSSCPKSLRPVVICLVPDMDSPTYIAQSHSEDRALTQSLLLQHMRSRSAQLASPSSNRSSSQHQNIPQFSLHAVFLYVYSKPRTHLGPGQNRRSLLLVAPIGKVVVAPCQN